MGGAAIMHASYSDSPAWWNDVKYVTRYIDSANTRAYIILILVVLCVVHHCGQDCGQDCG